MKRIIVALAATMVSSPSFASPSSFDCVPDQGQIISAGQKSHGFVQYRPNPGNNNVIDARGSTWYLNNSKVKEPIGQHRDDPEACWDANVVPEDYWIPIQRNPIVITAGGDSCFQGGLIQGHVSLTALWQAAYCNAHAIDWFTGAAGDTVAGNITIEGLRIDRSWDGISIRNYGEGGRHHTVRNVWMSNVRDDCIEVDMGATLTVQNSLLDGCFVGVSADPGGDVEWERLETDTITLDGVLLRIGRYPIRAYTSTESITYDMANPFKWFSTTGVSPALAVRNSIIAIEGWHQAGRSRWREAWRAIAYNRTSANNYFLWLSDKPFPWIKNGHPHWNNWMWAEYPGDDWDAGQSLCRNNNDLDGCYPVPYSFTIKGGREAREHWYSARARWIRQHPDIARSDGAGDPPPRP